jgi:ribosome-binding factor A
VDLMARARGRRGTQDRSGARQYPRTARLNELCQQIVADELRLIDDERLELVTITFVRVDRDMSRALVMFTSLGEDEAGAKEALESHRIRLQGAIGRQASMRRTPELRFEVDTVVETGNRIEQLLREAPPVRDEHPELTDGRYRLLDGDDPGTSPGR